MSTTPETKDCVIYIVRHGETEANVSGIIQGQTPGKLTLKGEKQAMERAKTFETIHFDAVYSSDLLRAKRTAELIVAEKKLAVLTTKALRERSYGMFEGHSFDGVVAIRQKALNEFEKLTAEDKLSFVFHPEIETDASVISRALTFLREIAVTYPGKTILFTTHGGLMRTLLIHFGYGSYDELMHGSVSNLAYVKVRTDGTDFFIEEAEGIAKKDSEKARVKNEAA